MVVKPVHHLAVSTASTVTNTECRNTSGTVERISTFVSPSETLSAEILWAIKVTTAHYSERSCDDAGKTSLCSR